MKIQCEEDSSIARRLLGRRSCAVDLDITSIAAVKPYCINIVVNEVT